MAVNHRLHSQRAEEAWPILVKRAKESGNPYTYGELSSLIGVHYRAAAWYLGKIQAYCKHHHLPPLQALAVNSKSRIPGGGYNENPQSLFEHEKRLQEVRAFDWDKFRPKFEEFLPL